MPKGGQFSGGLQHSPWLESARRETQHGSWRRNIESNHDRDVGCTTGNCHDGSCSNTCRRFAIMRNGEQIGTHAIEITRTGPETNVRITTDLTVKVLFVTAYRLQHNATERWVNGQLVAFESTTDNNGVRHKVSASRGASGLEVQADGKTTRVDQNVLPA